ncbi:MAG: hypothetical protein HY700_13435 [Gemmatimonadetes bacterium]|nr:hypothetical protein [Gemmatimonadota bacterium]
MSEPHTGGDEHPRGTLALVGLYGVLFALGWFAIYLFVYLPRGPVTQ